MREKLKLLKKALENNTKPILFTSSDYSMFDNYTILDVSVSIDDLNGHYEGTNYLPPEWYQCLCNSKNKLLIIDNMDNISKEEQKKFIEILKYKKVGVFPLPKESKIFITSKNISVIDSEVLSYCVVI